MFGCNFTVFLRENIHIKIQEIHSDNIHIISSTYKFNTQIQIKYIFKYPATIFICYVDLNIYKNLLEMIHWFSPILEAFYHLKTVNLKQKILIFPLHVSEWMKTILLDACHQIRFPNFEIEFKWNWQSNTRFLVNKNLNGVRKTCRNWFYLKFWDKTISLDSRNCISFRYDHNTYVSGPSKHKDLNSLAVLHTLNIWIIGYFRQKP